MFSPRVVGRVQHTIYQAGGQEKWRSTTAYGGDRVDVTPPRGSTPTTVVTDGRGQRTELWQYKGATASGDHDTVRYSYTLGGQLASTTDAAGNTWKWQYDLHGRQVRAEDVDKGVSTMTYDALGQLSTVTDALNNTLTYSYDKLGRTTSVKSGTTVLKDFTYDTADYGLGLPASSTRYVDGNAYTSRVVAYHPLDKPLLTETVIPDAEGPLRGSYRTTLRYKPNGSPESESFSAIGMAGMPAETVNYHYDELGRPSETVGGLRDASTDILVNSTAYTRYGELYRMELGATGKRAWLSYYYDENTRRMNRYIVDAEVPSPKQADVNYNYDDAGNIKSVLDSTVLGADRQCFRYDNLQRLTHAWTPSGDCTADPSTTALAGPAPYWQSFEYDAIGNRKKEIQHSSAGDITRTYNYSRAHALESVTTAGPSGSNLDRFTYDAAGNTKTRNLTGVAQTLDWDVEGRVGKISDNAKDTSFVYDASGSRLLRRDPDGTTLYLGGQEIRLAKGATKPTVTRYYTHGGQIVAMREGTTKLTWLANDHQGTAQIAVNRDTLAIDRRRQTPFGAPRGGAATFPGERGFVGGTIDVSTGLVELGARQYDPAIGRFISVDPILDPDDPQQWSAYAYANNSPITSSDPTGLLPMSCLDGAGSGTCSYKDNRGGGGSSASVPGTDTPSKGIVSSDSDNIDVYYDNDTGKSYIGDWEVIGVGPDVFHLAEEMRAIKSQILAHDWFPAPEDPDGRYSTTQLLVFAARACTYSQTAACSSSFTYQLSVSHSVAVGPGFDRPGGSAGIRGGGRKGGAALGGATAFSPRNFCRNSFTGDTLVLMADGTTKRIDEIEVGDRVLATDPEAGVSSPREVVATIIGEGDENLVEVSVGDAKVVATDGHPFWLPELKLWVNAEDLTAESMLQTAAGTEAQISATRKWTAFKRVYNLAVEGVHTYYVQVGDSSVLVHNCGPRNAVAGWLDKADFSKSNTMSKKYDAHAADFGVTGNRNKANLEAFEQAMKGHMTAPATKIYRFNYRNQGQAVGFIDPSSRKMVMLRADSGEFWTAYKLGDNQFSSIVDKGFLW